MFSSLRSLKDCHRKEGTVMFCEFRWDRAGTPWVKREKRFEFRQEVDHLALRISAGLDGNPQRYVSIGY